MKTRYEQKRDKLEAAVRLVALGIVLAVLLVLLLGAAPEAKAPSAEERRARFLAQERYYEVLDRYGDVEGATEVARMVWEEERTWRG